MAKKSGLGKGLGSLISEASAETGTTPDATLPITSIITNPNQPRKSFDETALQELADSIAQNGVLQPILVRKKENKYEIVAGERRYQASKIANLKEIPVLIKEISDDQVFQIALIENLQRKDLTPIEEAKGYKQLLDEQGLTQEGLAQILSKSRSAIANTLRLLDLPKPVQELVFKGELSAGHARTVLSIPDEDKRIAFAEKIAKEKLSVREAERIATLIASGEQERAKRPAAPRSFKIVAKSLRQKFNTAVKVKTAGGKNKIEIEFKDEDDLQRIYELITS